MEKISKRSIPVLLLKLEGIEDVKLYNAVKGTLLDKSMRILGNSQAQAEDNWRYTSLFEMIESIKSKTKKDPITIFLILVEIIARLSTKEEFKEFLKELLSDVDEDMVKAVILENPNLNLEFKKV
jgi:hypothetical protein